MGIPKNRGCSHELMGRGRMLSQPQVSNGITLSCGAEIQPSLPHRFAGTWKQYSRNAISQLATMTFHSAAFSNFKCPYHAIVMNKLEAMSKAVVMRAGFMLESSRRN